MPSIQYTGSAPIHETAITGKQQKWFPGQIQQVSDTDAALLKASGLGFVDEAAVSGAGDLPAASLTASQVAATQALVSGYGNRRPVKRMALIGHSFLSFGFEPGFGFGASITSAPSAIYGFGWQSLATASDKTLTITADGMANLGGASVKLHSGRNVVPGPVGLDDGLLLRVNMPQLTAGSWTVTRAGSLANTSIGLHNVMTWVEIFSGLSVRGTSFAAPGLTQQAMASDGIDYLTSTGALDAFDGIVYCNGTNDPPLRTLAQMQDDANIALTKLNALGKPVYVLIEPPYNAYLSGAAATRQQQYVDWLPGFARTFSNVVVVSAYASMVPETGTTARYSHDGVHPNTLAGQLGGRLLWQAMGSPKVDPFASPNNSASGYSPTLAPYANFMASQFLRGDNGSGVTNVPVCTTYLANATCTYSKVARTDGVAGDWQQLVFATSAADGEANIVSVIATPAGGFFPVGTVVELIAEVETSGSLIGATAKLGLFQTSTAREYGSNATVYAAQPNAVITGWSGVITSGPVKIQSGDNSLQILLGGKAANGTTGATVRFGRVMIRAVQ